MRIGVDARFWDSTRQGIDRFTGELIVNLSELDHRNTYFIFVRRDAQIPKLPENFQLVRVPYRWYGFSEQMAWPFFLTRFHLDLMHFTHFNVPLLYRRPFVVTIHDLILLHSRGTHLSTLSPVYFFLKYAAYKIVLASALKRAKGIVTISQYTKDAILKRYPRAAKKITVIYNGVTACTEATGRKALKLELPDSYALYVGNAYPHKKLNFLLEQFSIWAKDYPGTELVLVGKKDTFYTALETNFPVERFANIHFTGLIDDVTLAAAYRGARLFIMASGEEGFGMPVLEAMSAGIPVLAARAGATPEIAGTAALYFEPNDPEDFREKLSIAFFDEKMHEALCEKGNERWHLFSWRKAAQEYHALYSNLKNQYNS